MSDSDGVGQAPPRAERVQFALRQAGLVTVALLVAAVVTERLRPDHVPDRGLVSAIFWGAIVVWVLALLVDAGFERSQMRALQGLPLQVAGAIDVLAVILGMALIDNAIAYVFATALGTAMFWWGLLGLALLVVRRVSS